MRRSVVLSTLVGGFVLGLSGAFAQAALIVDSFNDGPFAFSHDQSSPLSQQQFGSMLGGERVVTLSTDRRPTIVSAAVLDGSSLLTFDTGTGPRGLGDQGEVILIYGGENSPYRPFASNPLDLDLSGFDSFEFDIPSLCGTGEVLIYLGSLGTDPTPVTLQATGTLRYPLSQTHGGSLADVDSIYICFRGLTADFALTIDEIRIVPEPVSVLFFLAGSVFLTKRRVARAG